MPVHVYETVVLDESGLFRASVLSLADSGLGGRSKLFDFLREAGFELEHGPAWRDRWEARDVLEKLATAAMGAPGPGAEDGVQVGAIIDDLWDAPITIVELSPAVGLSLSAIVAQGGAAVVASKSGNPGLVVAYESCVIVVWFLAGPITGIREGLRKAAEDVTEDYGRDIFRRWLNKRFGR